VTHSSTNGFAIARDRTRYVELFILLLASVGLWWRPIRLTLGLALSNDAYSHILLILPVSAALIYFETKQSSLTAGPREWIGSILLAVALSLLGFAAWNPWHASSSAWLSLRMSALVLWWIGSVIVCFGLRVFRSLLFPFCFLFLAIPLPERFVDVATEFLQHQSALASEILFRAARVPVTREGIILSIPALDIEVARECSSIRSSTMLILLTLILAHLFLHSSWRKVLLILVAIPLSVAKNAVRIFTITELGTRVDPSYLNGRLHHNGGFVFLGLALIVDIALLWILRRGEHPAAFTG
jgi:exosortase